MGILLLPDSAVDRRLADVAYSSGWGYYPSGGVGLIVVIIVILLVAGRL
jgi:hypothetical protein